MDKALQCIGLAKKAGRLATGTENVLEAVRNGKAVAVLAASDVSDNTAKLIRDKTASYNVKLIVTDHTRAELGNILGNAACARVAFTDNGFASMYQRATEQPRR